MILTGLGYFLIAVGVIVLIVALYIRRLGDADFNFDTDQRTRLILTDEAPDAMRFEFRVPFRNRGSQQGTLMDVIARPWMPEEQFSAATILPQVTIASAPREDGYWEAALFPMDKIDNDVAVIRLTFHAKQGGIRRAMSEMVDLPVNIIYQVVARSDWYMSKVIVTLPAEEFFSAIDAGVARQ